ncbi:formylglycine-generating enzyme family protein [Biostraticola tofi]|uniref:Formylglycine-generating enzyme required for sulfatase activity n=1 Tax=Biostraticola tofi TaxID=466109 RepID=A0A4R3Z4N7_9GAMM|nr:SUMF1/EgtB/PvdO family nonheme iron enzyme [Biostraticola tofi]TCW00157.1 formylglycine-generating enzyme required for sulfatase activity [Biostraticola tofi]
MTMYPYRSAYMLVLGLLIGCDDATSVQQNDSSPEVKKQIEKFNASLVSVEGGEFLMGDFGREHGKEKLYYDSDDDSKPLHRVQLSPFKITRFKIDNEQYQFYLKQNQLTLPEGSGPITKKSWDAKNKTPNTPAHALWPEAEKYCAWLSKMTGKKVALPTEAQWEYAARSKGKFNIVPTDDGTLRFKDSYGTEGINVAGEADRSAYSEKMNNGLESFSALPGDVFPPNPLGIYDMAGNGFEWVKDWYDPGYYQHSPLKDPQGPETPTFKNYDGKSVKVIRGQDYSGPGRGLTINREFSTPDNDSFLPLDKTFRCVVNE